ncbi:hypothetical protein ACS0TY_003932 [Phlomoides rotata]
MLDMASRLVCVAVSFPLLSFHSSFFGASVIQPSPPASPKFLCPYNHCSSWFDINRCVWREALLATTQKLLTEAMRMGPVLFVCAWIGFGDAPDQSRWRSVL